MTKSEYRKEHVYKRIGHKIQDYKILLIFVNLCIILYFNVLTHLVNEKLIEIGHEPVFCVLL